MTDAIGSVEQHRRRRHRRAEHVKAADVIVAHEPRQLIERVAVGAQEIRLEGRDDQLTDFLVERSASCSVCSTHRSPARSRVNGSRRPQRAADRKAPRHKKTTSEDTKHRERVVSVARGTHRGDGNMRRAMPDRTDAEHKARGARIGPLLRRSRSATRAPTTPTRSGRAIAELLDARPVTRSPAARS